MIKTILSGPGIIINGQYPLAMHTNSYLNNIGAGNMRFNSATSSVEVFDGQNFWQPLPTACPTVMLDPEVLEILAWAKKKMQQEKEIEELANQHAAVADAVQAQNRAMDAVKIAVALCRISP